jgi:hypothetical protein
MDVYFCGWGCWYVEDEDEDGPCYPWCSECYKASGIFRLDKEAAIAYKYTKNFDDVISLLPSTHPDDEFLKVLESGKGLVDEFYYYTNGSYSNMVFKIDPRKPRGKFYIVPDEPPEAETINNGGETEAGLTANEKRNNVAKKWIAEMNPDLDALTNKEILAELESFNKKFEIYHSALFNNGGNNWLSRDHSVIPKRKAGCKPGKSSKVLL